ncbi:hypothetical protein [Breoghania sp.]|uniref:hypothetical protein n=1 Tax=Breoghania sp. TaxID=2065378 RepID=UPI00260625D6|nr:hypothetical protein [Breoghania sp.]MDJ0929560.1 hypothetical protein [Breoghania sp.]
MFDDIQPVLALKIDIDDDEIELVGLQMAFRAFQRGFVDQFDFGIQFGLKNLGEIPVLFQMQAEEAIARAAAAEARTAETQPRRSLRGPPRSRRRSPRPCFPPGAL